MSGRCSRPRFQRAVKVFWHAVGRSVWWQLADRSPARYIFELNWRKCRAARLLCGSAFLLRRPRPFRRAAWPVVVSALLGSFLFAIYWHPQDYLALDATAAIMLAAGPLEIGVLMAIAVAVVSGLTNPLSPDQNAVAWLLLAVLLLGFLAVRAVTRAGPRRESATLPA